MSIACRPACGACCIAPSISSPIPSHFTGQASAQLSGQLSGKPAGVRCQQLDGQEGCRLFGDPRRPAVCGQLQPSAEMCGADRNAAMDWLAALEQATAPGKSKDQD